MKPSQVSLAIAAILLAPSGFAGPSSLSDSDLDGITAGTPGSAIQGSGGAIVGNNSEALLTLTGTLELSTEAQSGAMALNLVNSSESTVANGVNVWDGRLPDGAMPGTSGLFEVEQGNLVEQEQRRVALLPGYERTGANETSSWTEDSASSTGSSLARTTETRDLNRTETSRSVTSEGSVDTESVILGQTIRAGQGLAGSGDLAVWFDGGQIDFGVSGQLQFGSGNMLGSADASAESEMTLSLQLPEFTVDLEGSGCAVEVGSCSSNGTMTESSLLLDDNSVIATETASQESEESFVGGGSREVSSGFTLEGAQAEYLVVDNSGLEVDSNYGIVLSGSAQSNLRALNAVNAAGSAVANAVNISRTPGLTGTNTLALVQSNVIRHSR